MPERRVEPGSFLVVSDLHLSDFEEHADGWKAHKRACYSIDREFDALVDTFLGEGEGARTLVLNGDIFDFDLVTAVPQDGRFELSGSERCRGMLPTADKSAWKLQRMLSDHEGFVHTLAKLLAAGHKVVYVMGNHDRELHFPEVQQVLVAALRAAVSAMGARFDEAALRFEPWFYYVPGVLYAEHGQQYDYYSSFRNLLSPVVQTRAGRIIALSMGNLSNRYLVNRMGFFNPHASDYIMQMYHYVLHWLRFYAFSRHGIVWNWFWGSLLVVARLLALKKASHKRPADYDALLQQTASAAGLPIGTVRALGDLHRPPITMRFYRILREFWIDRLLLALLMLSVTVALAISGVPLWLKLMVPLSTFPLLYFIYESLARGETIFSAEHEIPRYAMEISSLLDARIVTFGHTHRPRVVPLGHESAFVDTGTWAPMSRGGLNPCLVPGFRNYLVVSCHRDRVSFELGSFMPVPRPERAAAADPAKKPAALGVCLPDSATY
jgi:UDP-2,3-diacylglucosamine pyrophosphatase LpxH